MKLYTLTYDCNKPVTQQINVPTNTDYKVGIKVKRNGEYQNLKVSEVKLYTGESTEIEPTDFNSTAADIMSSVTTVLVAMLPANISADLGEQTLNTIYAEYSNDGGTTWQETRPSVPTYAIVMDKANGNYYLGKIDISNPRAKWELLDGTGTSVIGTSDTLTTLTKPQIYINSFAGNWADLTTFPCKVRLVVQYGGYTKYEYISPDDELTNGYLTFTRETGDEAEAEANVIDIQHGFEDAVVEYFSKQNTGSSALTLNGELSATAESLGLTGKTVDAENFYIGAVRSANDEPTDAEVLSTLENPFYSDNVLYQNRFPVKKANGGYIIISIGPTREMYINEAKAKGQYKDGDGAIFFYSPDSTGQNWYPRKTYTFEADDVISLGWGKLQGGKWCKYCIDMNFGTPFDAKFKLTTNVFKSQQGDVHTVDTTSTVNLAGEYADGTEFSYDIMVK